jgi:hypothetical protein
MNVFPDVLQVCDAGMKAGSRVFRLTHRFRYLSSFGVIEVPIGAETDGASIPHIFWSLLEPFGPWFPAAIIHDHLYSPRNTEYSRWESDYIFNEAMYNVGVPFAKRFIIYQAVRAFGGRAFRAQIKTFP